MGGRYDTMDPAYMEKMAGLVGNGRFLYCANGSHMAMYDDQETYFAGLTKFIEDVDPGRFQGRLQGRGRDRLIERLVRTPGTLLDLGQLLAGHGILRVRLDRGPQVGNGFVGAAQLRQHDPKSRVGLGVRADRQ